MSCVPLSHIRELYTNEVHNTNDIIISFTYVPYVYVFLYGSFCIHAVVCLKLHGPTF